MTQLLGWRDVPLGGIIFHGGSSDDYETGGWRTFRPVRDDEKCSHCLRCWIYCPDSAVIIEDGKVVGYDMEHCKGCGMCARECPTRCSAVSMELDRDGSE